MELVILLGLTLVMVYSGWALWPRKHYSTLTFTTRQDPRNPFHVGDDIEVWDESKGRTGRIVAA